MPPDHADNKKSLWHALGVSKPPAEITQEAFEHDDRHLRRLVRLHPGDQAQPEDLWEYVHDLRNTKIQSALFSYLLPFCLQAWREDLRGTTDRYGGLIEYFYPLLADRSVFDLHLTTKQTAAVSEFMRQTILDEIDDQRGLSYQSTRAKPYRWIGALATYGVLRPDLARLWSAWWSMETVGRAVAAVQYISCLMYSQYENPIFSPWTPDGGGGPPCIWEFEGHLYTHRWLEPNVTFLRKTLNVSEVSAVLTRAVDRLVSQPEHETAALVQADFPLLTSTLQTRCTELPRLLEMNSTSTPLDWPA
jgi:hypothetical protein